MTYRIQKVHDLIDETDTDWNMFLNSSQLSNYFKLFNLMDEKERRNYNNKICSELAVTCEKYSKALYLKTATIPESIISRLNLTDDDVVNLIIGSNDERTSNIYGNLTREEKTQIKELKFRGISHDFTKVFDDNNPFLKNIQFYVSYSMKELKNVSNSELEDILYSDKVRDAFVKGRYSSLNDNDYDADFDTIIALCEALQRQIVQSESLFYMDSVEIISESNLNDFCNYKESIADHTGIVGGYQPRFRTIKHIHPVLGSKIAVINKDGEKKEYYFGEHKSVSLYKFVGIDGVNQSVNKSIEELLNDVETAPTEIGLYSVTNGANSIMELNDAWNLSGLTIEDGGSIIFEDDNGLRCVSNEGGLLIFKNPELIKNNRGGKK